MERLLACMNKSIAQIEKISIFLEKFVLCFQEFGIFLEVQNIFKAAERGPGAFPERSRAKFCPSDGNQTLRSLL
jgi:hypothetical protein